MEKLTILFIIIIILATAALGIIGPIASASRDSTIIATELLITDKQPSANGSKFLLTIQHIYLSQSGKATRKSYQLSVPAALYDSLEIGMAKKVSGQYLVDPSKERSSEWTLTVLP